MKTRISRLAWLWILLVAAAPWTAVAQPEALPSQADLHKLFKDGQYQPLLQKLSRVLQLKGAAAAPYDHVDLTVLRGETFLQLRQQSKAVEQFQAAMKELNATDPRAMRDPKVVEEQRRQ